MKAYLLITIILLNGCGNYFAPDIHYKEKVGIDKVVGTWILEPETIQYAKEAGFIDKEEKGHTITISKDGTCYFSSLIEHGEKSGSWFVPKRFEGSGKWSIEFIEGDPRKWGGVRNELSLSINHRAIDFYFTEEDGSLILWNWWSDPDLWKHIKYRKEPTRRG